MKILFVIISTIIYYILFAAIGFGIFDISIGGGGRDTIKLIMLFLGFLFAAFVFPGLFKRTNSELVSDIISESKNKIDEIKRNVEDGELEYMSIAESEIDNGTYDKNLWAKALVNAEGDETKRKSEYIKLRARYLKNAN